MTLKEDTKLFCRYAFNIQQSLSATHVPLTGFSGHRLIQEDKKAVWLAEDRQQSKG